MRRDFCSVAKALLNRGEEDAKVGLLGEGVVVGGGEFFAVVGGFEEVFVADGLAAVDEVAEFFEVAGPLEAVEELGVFELGFVEGVLGVAGAEVGEAVAGVGEEFDGGGHHEHAEVALVVVEVVEGVVVVAEAGFFEVEGDGADFLAGFFVGEEEDVGEDFGGEDAIQPFVGHFILTEFDVGVGFVEVAALVGKFELFARDEGGFDVGAFAEDAAVFGGEFEIGEIDADVAAEVKAVELGGAGEEAGAKEVGRSFARLGEGPDGVGEDVVFVRGPGFGEEEFHDSLGGLVVMRGRRPRQEQS